MKLWRTLKDMRLVFGIAVMGVGVLIAGRQPLTCIILGLTLVTIGATIAKGYW